MADEGKVCVCPQCGKKYKLKEGFDAKSFSCKACGATVWVAGKPPAPAPTTSRPVVAATAAQGGGRGGPTAASHGTGRRSRRGGEHERDAGRRGRPHAKPKSNRNVWIAVGGVAMAGIVIVLIAMSGGKSQAPSNTHAAGTGLATTTPPPQKPADATAKPKPPVEQPAEQPKEAPADGGTEPAPPPDEEPQKPKLGGDPKKGEKVKSKWDPPATLGHLETTPPELRKQIDDWIALVMDTQAGRDSLEAKAKLAATGKPAFLPVLGKMAQIRDTIADTDSMEERLIESSLKLADECLREMDGYLDAHDKAPIRPGTERNYIEYVLRIHYRRWMDGMGSRPLKDMETMPGPFDPTTMQKVDDKGEEEEEAGK